MAQGSDLRYKRFQCRSFVFETRYAGIGAGLQGNVKKLFKLCDAQTLIDPHCQIAYRYLSHIIFTS